MTKAEKVIRKYYGIKRRLTKSEIRSELASLKRKSRSGTLDDIGEKMHIAIFQRKNPRRRYRRRRR